MGEVVHALALAFPEHTYHGNTQHISKLRVANLLIRLFGWFEKTVIPILRFTGLTKKSWYYSKNFLAG
jgi:hypothetical protein